MTPGDATREAVAWQVGVWDRMSEIYTREIDPRFAPVVDAAIRRAHPATGESVLDLGCGTGAVAERAASLVGPAGSVVGVDLSPEMLALANGRLTSKGFRNAEFREGRAEKIPADNASFDVVVACLSLMFVIDRKAAAVEIARTLKPGGRFVAAVWGAPDECDIVQFQQTAARFAGPPPVPGVGPGSLADPASFVDAIESEGVDVHVEAETLSFEFPDFALAWSTLAGVTTTDLAPEDQARAKQAVLSTMYGDPEAPRVFRNRTLFITGQRRAST